jgi:hypothetical protein
MKTSQTNQEADRDAQQHQHGDPNVAQSLMKESESSSSADD